MCTTLCCGEHFLSVGVDLWGPADESTLIDENPPFEGILTSLTGLRKRTLSRSALNLKHEKSKVVDVRIKPLSANWMIKLYDYMKLNPGFAAAGIKFNDYQNIHA